MEVDVQTAKIAVFVIVRYRPKGRSPYPAVQPSPAGVWAEG